MLPIAMLMAAALGQAAPDPTALVGRLGSANVAEQKEATAALLRLGRDAMPALLPARRAADVGLRQRALELCTRIEGRSLGRPTGVRINLRDVPIDRAIAGLGRATGWKMTLSRSSGRAVPEAIRKRITLVKPDPLAFWEAFELFRRAGGLELMALGPPMELGFAEPGAEGGPVSVSGPFRGQLTGIRRSRLLELGKASRGIDARTRAVPPRGAPVDPKAGPTRETFAARIWIQPEPGARVIPLPIEQNPPLPPGPGLKYRPAGTVSATRAEDEQGRSLRPPGPPPYGLLSGSNHFSEYLVEVPLAMPDPPSHRLARLDISVPFAFLEERQDPIDVPLAGVKTGNFRGSGATLTVVAAKFGPSTMQVTVTPDPPLASGSDKIRGRPGRVEFLDDQGKPMQPEVRESNSSFGGRQLDVRFRAGESPATLRYVGRVQLDTVAVFRFAGIPLP